MTDTIRPPGLAQIVAGSSAAAAGWGLLYWLSSYLQEFGAWWLPPNLQLSLVLLAPIAALAALVSSRLVTLGVAASLLGVGVLYLAVFPLFLPPLALYPIALVILAGHLVSFHGWARRAGWAPFVRYLLSGGFLMVGSAAGLFFSTLAVSCLPMRGCGVGYGVQPVYFIAMLAGALSAGLASLRLRAWPLAIGGTALFAGATAASLISLPLVYVTETFLFQPYQLMGLAGALFALNAVRLVPELRSRERLSFGTRPGQKEPEALLSSSSGREHSAELIVSRFQTNRPGP